MTIISWCQPFWQEYKGPKQRCIDCFLPFFYSNLRKIEFQMEERPTHIFKRYKEAILAGQVVLKN